jgi:hypothetical protein
MHLILNGLALVAGFIFHRLGVNKYVISIKRASAVRLAAQAQQGSGMNRA